MSSIYAASAPRPERIDLILNQLDQLPTLPQVAIRVLQATRNEGSSARDVVNLISSDQSLTTKILRLVSKASVASARDVNTVDQAVVLLGFEAVRHAVLSVAVFDTFSKMNPTRASRFDREAFWRHSLAVACAAQLIAERWPGEVDPEVACVCGLLHDIGKAADHEVEGGHPKIGADLLKRHGEGPDVVHAALGHHDEIVTTHPYTMLVATADACSASRPGARRETLERYIKRMEELESIASGFKGVDQAFAIQAGRELRVMVSSHETDDTSAAKICRDIAQAFEEQLVYPGEIKVTVVRESRFSSTAR